MLKVSLVLLCSLFALVPLIAADVPVTQPASKPVEVIPDDQSLTWTDAAGKPLVGLHISLHRDAKPDLEYTTNAAGKSWHIKGEGYRMLTLTHPTFKMEIAPDSYEIFPSERNAILPFFITPRHVNEITGTVLDPAGRPVAGARVRIACTTFDGGGSSPYSFKWLFTRPDGTFAFAHQAVERPDFIPPGQVYHVDVLAPQFTGPLPQRVRVQAGKPETIKLKTRPLRNIILLDAEGHPLTPTAAAVAMNACRLQHETTPGVGTEGVTHASLFSLTNVPLPTGTYTLRGPDLQFGPQTLPLEKTGEKPRDLILQAPRPTATLLTVIDAATGKPAPGKTVIASTHYFRDSDFFSYLTPQQWQEVLAVKTRADVKMLRGPSANWFNSLSDEFAVFTTDSKGQVDLKINRPEVMDSVYAIVLGPDDFPLPVRIEALSEGGLPQAATLYRYPTASVLVTPARKTSSYGTRASFAAEVTLAPDASAELKKIFSDFRFDINSVESGVTNRLTVPAGVPLYLKIRAGGDMSYRSPPLLLTPGQTFDLGEPAITQRVGYQVAISDIQGRSLPPVPLFVKQGDGPFKPLVNNVETSSPWIEFDGYGQYTLGFYAPWQEYPSQPGKAPVQEPFYQTQINLKKEDNPKTCWPRFDVAYGHLALLTRLSAIPTISFTDALGAPMPKGTLLTSPAKAAPTATLDGKGSLSGKEFARVFDNNLVISHPDYGSAIVNDLLYQTINWNLPQALPLASSQVSSKTTDNAFLATGTVVDSVGKPMPGLRVMVCVPGFAPIQSRHALRNAPIQALTAQDGSYRLHPIIGTTPPARVAEIRAAGPTGSIAVSSPDPWVFGYAGPVTYGKPQTITAIKAEKTFTVTAPVINGMPANLANWRITFKPASGSDEIHLGYFFSNPGKPIPLAYGTYTVPVGLQPLIVDAQSPANLIIGQSPPLDPMFVSGSLTDRLTGRPVPGALVLGVSYPSRTGQDIPFVNDEFWQTIASLATPFNVHKELPSGFVGAIGARTGARADPRGIFLIPYPADPENRRPPEQVSLYILAKGYVPMTSTFELAKLPKDKNTFQLPPIQLFPAATVTLQPDEFPGASALPPDMHAARIVYQWNEALTPKMENDLDLPSALKTSSKTFLIPAGVSTRFFLNSFYAYGNDVPRPGIYYPAWEQTGEPLTLKQGEEATLKLKRVKQVPVTVQFISPEGKPIVGLDVNWFVALKPDLQWPASQETNSQGLVTLLLPANRKTTLTLAASQLGSDFPRIEQDASDAPSTKPTVVTLTPEQWKRILPTLPTAQPSLSPVLSNSPEVHP